MIYYDGRLFRPVKTDGNSDTDAKTIFRYRQKYSTVTAEYSGGKIRFGHLIGTVDENGEINMRYHHITTDSQLMTGTCRSVPEILKNGKIRLHETWQWTSGDKSSGTSVLEEV